MTGAVSAGQAAKMLGVHLMTIEARAVAAGWLASVARGHLLTTGGGVAGGFVVPVVQAVRVGVGRGVVNREVGYQITPAGVAALRQMAPPPKALQRR